MPLFMSNATAYQSSGGCDDWLGGVGGLRRPLLWGYHACLDLAFLQYTTLHMESTAAWIKAMDRYFDKEKGRQRGRVETSGRGKGNGRKTRRGIERKKREIKKNERIKRIPRAQTKFNHPLNAITFQCLPPPTHHLPLPPSYTSSSSTPFFLLAINKT